MFPWSNSEETYRALSDAVEGTDLRISVCLDAPDFSGYPNISYFLDDWAENKTTTLLLCPGIEYETTQSIKLPENKNLLTITCVDPSQLCSWNALNGSHIFLQPREELMVVVEGVTFVSSTESSVIIEVDAQTIMSVSFLNCNWKINTGRAVIEIIALDKNENSSLASITNRSKAEIIIANSMFDLNTVTNSIIYLELANLTVKDSYFRDNFPENSIIYCEIGALVVSNSTMEDMIVTTGAIYVSEQASINVTHLCGNNLDARSLGCNGTFFKANETNPCEETELCVTSCEQLESCQLTSKAATNECYSTWDDLIVALNLASEGILEICAGSIMDVTDLIEVTTSKSLEVRCGPNGTSESSCLVTGGGNHFRIQNPVVELKFQGMTFAKSTNTSIELALDPSQKANVTFQDCLWSDNDGSSAIAIRSVSSSGQRHLQGDASEILSTVEIIGSSFVKNIATGHLILNNGATLVINDSTFSDNSVEKAIIGAIGGDTMLDTVQFLGNEIKLGSILVGIKNNRFESTGACGSDNTPGALSCNGTFYDAVGSADPACMKLDDCGSDSDSKSCYSTWNDFSVALALRNESVFEICGGSELLLAKSDQPVEIATDVDIQCGPNGMSTDECIIKGGAVQFRIMDPASTVSFRGINFRGATNISVEVTVDPAVASSIYFSDCHWSSNTGRSVVSIILPKISRRYLADAGTKIANITILQSSFKNNNCTESVISNGAIDLTVVDTVFEGNTAGESMIELATGNSELRLVTFTENVARRGVVYVEFGAEYTSSQLCGTSNISPISNCTGILQSDVANDACLSGSIADCQATCDTIDECSDVPTGVPSNVDAADCYSDWEELLNALLKSEGNEDFLICGNTVFNLDGNSSPLIINSTDVSLRCGVLGQRRENCTIIGGSRQLVLGDTKNARIEGITFVGTKNSTAVFALGNKTSDASFYDCEFSRHRGIASFVIASSRTFEDIGRRLDELGPRERHQRLLQISTLPEKVKPAMTIRLENCTFDENAVEIAPLTNLGGKAYVENCQFDGNSGEVGAVVTIFEGSLYVASSCFTQNEGNITASVLIQSESILLGEIGNYGSSDALSKDCNGVLFADNETCLVFTSEECRITSPESSPSSSPSKVGSAINSSCLSDWEDLYSSVKAAKDGENILICKNTTFKLGQYEDAGIVPLVITANNIDIGCEQGHMSCTFSGGTRHIDIRGSVENIHLRGLVFTDASESSTIATIASPSRITFENCEWSKNNGNATITAVDPSISGQASETTVDDGLAREDDLLLGGRFLNDGTEQVAQLVCNGCIFDANTISASVVAVKGVDLTLDAVQFINNNVEGYLISAEYSNIEMLSSCLSGNDAGKGLVDGEVSGTGNFAADNGRRNLADFEFDSDKCIAKEKLCYTNWQDLSTAVSQSNSSATIYTLCANTDFEVGSSLPITVTEKGTTFKCGLEGKNSGQCVVRGGNIPFQLSGTPTDVVFAGITFTGAAVTSIFAGGGRSARAKISDCSFLDSSGVASILLYDGNLPTSLRPRDSIARILAISDFAPPATRSMSVDLEYCTFKGNTHDLAPVAVLGGTIGASSCEFTENSGVAGGIATWFKGGINMVDCCFTGNTASLSGGVYTDANSTATEENTYSDTNTVSTGTCEDLLLSGACESEGVCNGLCVEFTATSCEAGNPPTGAPTVAPSVVGEIDPTNENLDCLGTTELLIAALQKEKFDKDSEVVFTLCPNTMYKVNDPFVIERGNAVVQCGANGKLEDNCTISGGTGHFKILDATTRLSLRGLQMTGAQLVSIQALASSTTKLTVDSCLFERNLGSAVVLIYNQEAGEKYTDQEDLGTLSPLSDKSLTAEFDSCQFVANEARSAVIFNVDGSIQFIRNTFVGNIGTQAGVIAGTSGATVSISSSCFVENESTFPGSVFLASKAKLKLNQDNFGSNNSAANDCSDIFSETSGNCFKSGTCDGVCSVFESIKCVVPGSEYANPTSAPSIAPTDIDGGSSKVSPSGNSSPELQQASFVSSPSFIVIIVLLVLVVFGCAGSYLYCTKRSKKVKSGLNGGEGDDLLDEEEGRDESSQHTRTPSKPVPEAKPEADDAEEFDDEDDEDVDEEEDDDDDEEYGRKSENTKEAKGGRARFFGRKKSREPEKQNKNDDLDEEFGDESFREDSDRPKKKKGLFQFKKKKKSEDRLVAESDPLGIGYDHPMGTSYNRENSDSDMS